jgi:hypothetical protein
MLTRVPPRSTSRIPYRVFGTFKVSDSYSMKTRWCQYSDVSSGFFLYSFGLNPAQLSEIWWLTGFRRFPRRILTVDSSSLKIYWEGLNVLSQNWCSDTYTCISCLIFPRHKTPAPCFNDITKVLHLLSFSTLILQRHLCAFLALNHSTTPQVLNPSDSVHFLQQQSSISFAQFHNWDFFFFNLRAPCTASTTHFHFRVNEKKKLNYWAFINALLADEFNCTPCKNLLAQIEK